MATIAAAWLGATPTSGAAATRYAAPAGTGTACTAEAPCSISEAVGGAQAADTVQAAGGTYVLAETLVVPRSMTLRAADLADRPRLEFGDDVGVSITGGNVTLDGLDVRSSASSVAVASDAGAVTLRRSILRDGWLHVEGVQDHEGPSPSPPLQLNDTLITGGMLYTRTRNVHAVRTTIVAGQDQPAARTFQGNHLRFDDSILTVRPGRPLAQSGTPGDGSSITARYSLVSNTQGLTATENLTVGADPLFRDPAAGNFHLGEGSPAIGAGDPLIAAAGTDPDGFPRVAAPGDQGAFAYRPLPQVSLDPASEVSTSAAKLSGSVATAGDVGRARLTLIAGATETELAAVELRRDEEGQPIGAQATGLAPSTTYTYRLTATTPQGAVTTERTFTTAADPPPPPPPGECANGLDDDRDGFVDAKDPRCAATGKEAPADDPLLACAGERFVLSDVLPRGRRVRLAGRADPALAGQVVQLYAGTRRVGRATVAPDGGFAATVRAARSRTARYSARLGDMRSPRYKLNRKAVDAAVARVGDSVRLTARVRRAVARRGGRVTLQVRQGDCGPFIEIAKGRLARSGRVVIEGPLLPGVEAAVYRARIDLARGGPTFTLPRVLARG